MTYVAQEGGDHYQAEYQHWDWAIDVGLGYLDGCATKYVSRWWKKNGLQDLLKARTYVIKMISNFDAVYSLNCQPPDNVDELNARFCEANNLPQLEYEFCRVLSSWEGTQQLQYALRLLDELITRAAGQGQAPAAPTLAATPGEVPTAPADGRFLASKGQAIPHRASVDGMEHPFGYDDWHEGGPT